jgi:hypothetical protein
MTGDLGMEGSKSVTAVVENVVVDTRSRKRQQHG